MRINFKAVSDDWERWFAWRPVFVGNTLVWLEYVERKLWANQVDQGWEYRA